MSAVMSEEQRTSETRPGHLEEGPGSSRRPGTLERPRRGVVHHVAPRLLLMLRSHPIYTSSHGWTKGCAPLSHFGPLSSSKGFLRCMKEE